MLRLHAWCTSEYAKKQQYVYELVALVFHSGLSATSGHYVCAARGDVAMAEVAQARKAAQAQQSVPQDSSPLNMDASSSSDTERDDDRLWLPDRSRWFLFDDATVSHTSEADIQELMSPCSTSAHTAFLLFYQQRS